MNNACLTLLIDAGNTRIKFGWLEHGSMRREPVALALAHAQLGELAAWLAALPVRPSAALGASVVSPGMRGMLDSLIESQCGVTVQWQHSSACAGGVLNLYDDPGKLGTDRWISLIGLAARTSAPAVLASFGTATTVDTLGPADTREKSGPVGRRFEGGLILPGPELMRHALANGTAGLPYAEGASTDFPRNTHSAISSGIAAAQAGAVLRQWRSARDALGQVPELYCAGGGWPLVAAEVTAMLARQQADLGLPVSPPHRLVAPVLDGLASLAATSST
ncbi:MAG: type III pantothenate kinase [Burkholderiaceae bacterium]